MPFWRVPEVQTGWKTKLKRGKEIGVDTVVSLLTRSEEVELGLTEESDLVRRNGLTFINFPIPDYSVPRSQGATREVVDEIRDHFRAETEWASTAARALDAHR